MATTRERREARAERLRGWADKREAKADAGYSSYRAQADMIPFGQPIMGARDRSRREKLHAKADRSFADAKKAEEMRSKAANIEAAAAHAIYSDDDDAVQRLEEKIATLEAERDRIKRYNASCRKGAPDPSILTEAELADLTSVLRHAPFQSKGGAFPSYKLSNLGKTITTARKRLESLR